MCCPTFGGRHVNHFSNIWTAGDRPFLFCPMFQPFVATATVAAMHHFETGADAQEDTAFSLSYLILYNSIYILVLTTPYQ